MYSLWIKGELESVIELNPVCKEFKTKQTKEEKMKEILMLTVIEGVVTSGQNPTQLSFSLVKRN